MYYWWGLSDDKNRWELFCTDNRRDANVEDTGYSEIQGPWFSKSEAEENDPN